MCGCPGSAGSSPSPAMEMVTSAGRRCCIALNLMSMARDPTARCRALPPVSPRCRSPQVPLLPAPLVTRPFPKCCWSAPVDARGDGDVSVGCTCSQGARVRRRVRAPAYKLSVYASSMRLGVGFTRTRCSPPAPARGFSFRVGDSGIAASKSSLSSVSPPPPTCDRKEGLLKGC